ncbi:hypothetical protein DMC47_32960 [Nostoc sp. 3335mG]|nr:hypothetical protein DMC47_32960 [Nostoc sp. 3335mG]
MPAVLAATPAGTAIPNTAIIFYQQDGADHQTTSNVAQVAVEEELGIALDWAVPGAIETAEHALGRVPVVLINRGNGHEAFVLDGSITGVDATIDGFAVPGGQSGSSDDQIARGGTTIELAPGQALRLMVLVRGGDVGRGTLNVSAHALTGYGKPGTSFPQKGDGGCTAVVGPTTAAATLSIPMTITGGGGNGEPAVVLDKTQQVVAADGSANPTHGAAITYTLNARVTGVGIAQGAVVTDPIPEGTDYVPGSLTLDGSAIADGGNLDASGIAVPLGDVAAGSSRTITFKVTIR